MRRVTLDFQHGQWLLDGRTFDMMDTMPEETLSQAQRKSGSSSTDRA